MKDGRMSQTGLERLDTLRKLNENSSWLNQDLYRLLYKKDLYVTAYEKIKSRPGNMNPAADDSTIDDFSLEEIEKTIARIKDCSFQFSDFPPGEKVVQEIIRMVLEAIYDSPENPYFLDCSHGFRNGRGTHTALKEIRKWQGTCWFIQGDIKGCFDDIDHDKLLGIMSRKISDSRFLDLIRKALKSGCLAGTVSKNTLSGTPQGSIITPILANIYLHELDCLVNELITKHNKGENSRPHPATESLSSRMGDRKGKGEVDEVRELAKRHGSIPSVDPDDSNDIRVRYSRYADDWLIGIVGPGRLAEEIKSEVEKFLSDELKLEPNSDRPHIRHARSEKALFLGTLICTQRTRSPLYKQNRAAQNGRRFKGGATGWLIQMEAPIDDIVKSLHLAGLCDGKGNPTHKASWIARNLEEIVTRANAVLRGYRNYYSFVDNYRSLRRIEYIIQFSCAKTISSKMRLRSLKKTFRKYTKALKVSRGSGAEEVQLDLAKSYKRDRNRFLIKPSGGPKGDLSALYFRRFTQTSRARYADRMTD
jgi:hypothetical protein